MPRPLRPIEEGLIYHVIARGNNRQNVFHKVGGFKAFLQALADLKQNDGDLGAFMQKLTIAHARNWQLNRRRVGYGHLDQGRYKSFPIESDERG